MTSVTFIHRLSVGNSFKPCKLFLNVREAFHQSTLLIKTYRFLKKNNFFIVSHDRRGVHLIISTLRKMTVMLWSQIKLTPYDFSDLQITGEFKNGRSSGRFLKNFSCVVTDRMDAGRRLYMKTLAGVERDQPGTDFTRISQFFKSNDVYIIIKIRCLSSKETGC